MAASHKTYEVTTKKLALFETLMDTEPTRYLDKGDKVRLIQEMKYYGGKHGDKQYYKVQTPWYEVGYILAEGITEVTPK